MLKSSYKCTVCGEIHEGWPAIGFMSPHAYHNLSEKDKVDLAELSSDFCTIKYEDQTDRFIRVVLKQKVLGQSETLEYGLWVSLSEKSYNDYVSNYNNHSHQTTYFGYLCSLIPGYVDTLSVKINVVTGLGNNRPEIFPHDDQLENDFVKDYFEGITKQEAERRISMTYHGG